MTIEQVAWAVTGLLAAALFGNFWFLASKIDSINARIDALGDRIDAHLDAMAARLDSMVGRLNTHIDSHFDRP
jgi:hypothetical protein